MRILQGTSGCDEVTFLDELELDLRAKRDRSDAIDDLFQMTFSEPESVERVSWCLAKMAQNKYADMRIHGILLGIADIDPGTDENVMWGLGELAGTGIGDDASFALIKRKMKDPDASVRGMAAWAAGRYRHRLPMTDEESESILTELLEDDSPLVKASAEFALADEESK